MLPANFDRPDHGSPGSLSLDHGRLTDVATNRGPDKSVLGIKGKGRIARAGATRLPDADRDLGAVVRISDERDRPFRDRDRGFRQRDRAFRERDRPDRKAGLALRMTSTARAMLAGFCRRDHARAPDEHAHDQGRFET